MRGLRKAINPSPVDINIARIAVRLGWVPVLVEGYPELESVQKYLLPRLCNLDQETLYELHYQMITFGKVFCTKREPNCKACRNANILLVHVEGGTTHSLNFSVGNMVYMYLVYNARLVLPNSEKDMGTSDKVSPELKCPQISIGDIEDVPTIKLNEDGSTPKQIRDMMKVDGLTNDEVKSHLQKYRMHIRKHPLYPAAKTLPSSDQAVFNNNGHSSEDEEKSDGPSSWKSESNKKRQALDLEL
ncbi:hypothetical protein YC2023_007104 [Brassica napus]